MVNRIIGTLAIILALTCYVVSAPLSVEAYNFQTSDNELELTANSAMKMEVNDEGSDDDSDDDKGKDEDKDKGKDEDKDNADNAGNAGNQGTDAGSNSGSSSGAQQGSSGSSGSSSQDSGTGSQESGYGDYSSGGGAYKDTSPPIAIHNGPFYAKEGEDVLFDAMASHDSNGIRDYEWDFGDGSKANGGAVRHAFYNDGIYTVTLKVIDSAGNWRTETTIAKIANSAPSLAEPNLNVQESCVSLDESFSDKGKLDMHSAMIDWGDGNVKLGKITEENGAGTIFGNHVYQKSGTYNLEIKLYDDDSYSSKIVPLQVTKRFDYSMEVESKELVIERGSAGMNKLNIKVISCSSEEIRLIASGLPLGTSAEFTSSKDEMSFTSLMAISATRAAMLGEQLITVTANGGGITKTQSFLLKIVDSQENVQNNLRDLVLPVLITSSEQSGEAPLNVRFQGIVGGGEAPYTWIINFGDGTEHILKTDGIKLETSHEYAKQGEYEVHVKVRDSNSSTGKSESLKITVDRTLADGNDGNLLDRMKIFTSSLIMAANFDAKHGSIALLASGSDGTKGWTSLTIPKAILNPPFTVKINGEDTEFDLADERDNYVLSFSYHHSTKLIMITGMPLLLPVQGDSEASESSIKDLMSVVQMSDGFALGSSNINTLDQEAGQLSAGDVSSPQNGITPQIIEAKESSGNSLFLSNSSIMSLSGSWILMLAGGSVAGTIYYAVVARRKHPATIAIDPASTVPETGQKMTISIIPRSVTLSAGESIMFYAQAYDEESNEVHDIDFTWSTTVKDAQLICERRSARFIAPGDAGTGDTKLFGVRKGEVIVSHGNIAASANVEVNEF